MKKIIIYVIALFIIIATVICSAFLAETIIWIIT